MIKTTSESRPVWPLTWVTLFLKPYTAVQILCGRSRNDIGPLFSSAWLCQQKSWNRNLSFVVRLSVSQFSLNLMRGLLSNFSCCFLWARRYFFILKKCFFLISFLRIFFVFVNMGPYGSENFKTLHLLQIAVFFFLIVSTVLRLGFVKFEIEILMNCIHFR